MKAITKILSFGIEYGDMDAIFSCCPTDDITLKFENSNNEEIFKIYLNKSEIKNMIDCLKEALEFLE